MNRQWCVFAAVTAMTFALGACSRSAPSASATPDASAAAPTAASAPVASPAAPVATGSPAASAAAVSAPAVNAPLPTTAAVPATASTAGLVGYWKMDDASGSKSAADGSGHANPGLCGGSNIARGSGTSIGPCPSFGAPGRHGTAADYSGGGQYVLVNNTIPASFTVSAWIKTTQVGDGAVDQPAYAGTGIVWSDEAGPAEDMIPMAMEQGRLAFGTGDCNSGGYDTLISASAINGGQWMHVAVTRDTATGRKQIYVNGKLDASNSGGGACSLDANKRIAIGGNPLDGRYFKGQLEDVRFYDRVLTAAEVAALGGTDAPTGTPGAASVQAAVATAASSAVPATTASGENDNWPAALAARQITVQLSDADGHQLTLTPAEKVAYIFVENMASRESDCYDDLKRGCSLDELVNGGVIDGHVMKKLAFDPRQDPNYSYTVASGASAWEIHADAKVAGLRGFYSTAQGNSMFADTYFDASGKASAISRKTGNSAIGGGFFAQ